MGYNHIFCIVDMDTKDVEPERSQYQKLKVKYAKPVAKPKKGIYCKVEFFETPAVRNYSSSTISDTHHVYMRHKSPCSKILTNV